MEACRRSTTLSPSSLPTLCNDRFKETRSTTKSRPLSSSADECIHQVEGSSCGCHLVCSKTQGGIYQHSWSAVRVKLNVLHCGHSHPSPVRAAKLHRTPPALVQPDRSRDWLVWYFWLRTNTISESIVKSLRMRESRLWNHCACANYRCAKMTLSARKCLQPVMGNNHRFQTWVPNRITRLGGRCSLIWFESVHLVFFLESCTSTGLCCVEVWCQHVKIFLHPREHWVVANKFISTSTVSVPTHNIIDKGPASSQSRGVYVRPDTVPSPRGCFGGLSPPKIEMTNTANWEFLSNCRICQAPIEDFLETVLAGHDLILLIYALNSMCTDIVHLSLFCRNSRYFCEFRISNC